MIHPEEEYSTIITDENIRVEHPTRKPEEIRWDDIREIRLANTDDGPISPDIWMVLIGENNVCSIPHGSIGYDQFHTAV